MSTKFSIPILFLLLALLACSSEEDVLPIQFTVIGDTPYGASQRSALIEKIAIHDSISTSSFVVHVGDIKSGQDPCDEDKYVDVSTMLGEFDTPTFILLGDNEFNDCDNPNEGRSFWDKHFLNFHEQWAFDESVIKQAEREENWAWFQDDVLMIGLNLVGSIVHDQVEWDSRMADNVTWLRQQYESHSSGSGAIVVFGHANMVDFGAGKFETFTDELIDVANAFGKPMVYIQGDGHSWIDDTPWSAPNLRRIQIVGGKEFLDVKVDLSLAQPFLFTQDAY